MTDLKPCPFCGEPAELHPEGSQVWCTDCGASGDIHGTSVEAIAAWNTRTPSPDRRDVIEALKPLAQICEPDDFADKPDGTVLLQFGLREITLGDIRRARTALSPTPEGR